MFQVFACKSAGTKHALLCHFSVVAVMRTGQQEGLLWTATHCITFQRTKQFHVPISEEEGAAKHDLSSQPLTWPDRVVGRIQRKVFSVKVKKLGTGEPSECCKCLSPPMVFFASHWGDEVASCFHYSFLHYPSVAWIWHGMPVGSQEALLGRHISCCWCTKVPVNKKTGHCVWATQNPVEGSAHAVWTRLVQQSFPLAVPLGFVPRALPSAFHAESSEAG